MFIAVYYSDDDGFDHHIFATHKEAWEYIAGSVKEWYDNFDLMKLYPFDDLDDCLHYDNDGVRVFADSNWCNCYNHKRDYSDHWTIIEV